MSLSDDLKSRPDAETTRRIRELERKLAKSQSTLSGLQKLYTDAENDLASANKTIELFTATQGEFTRRDQQRTTKRKDGTATAIIVATDWHAEERVDPATVEGKNEFHLGIAQKRIRQLWDKSLLLLESERHLSRIDECLLACLGDLMGGDIHEELSEQAAKTPVEMIVWLQDELADGIRYLKKHGGFKRIRVGCCSGNHGRTTKKQRVSTRESHSYEWLVYHNVAREFASDKAIEFAIAKGIILHLDVEGYRIRLTHGDSFKFAGGIGGLSIPAGRRVAKWNETHKAYLTLFGHWHQMVIGSNYIACPTLKGYDPFSVWIGAPAEPPSQLFAVVDRNRGLTVAKRIFVE